MTTCKACDAIHIDGPNCPACYDIHTEDCKVHPGYEQEYCNEPNCWACARTRKEAHYND